MNVLGIIPARGGSKGVKRKNIAYLGDKPLIAYTIEVALQSKLNRVIVSTEDDEIIEVALNHGANVPFKRPMELALDTSNSIDVAIHGLNKMELLEDKIYDAVMYLQPTTPFRSASDINNCIDLLEQNKQADSVISVVDVNGYYPERMKYIENGYLIDPEFGEKKEGQNRQELRSIYIKNGAVYLSRRQTLLNGTLKGDRSLAYEMSYYDSVNIDTVEDFEFAQWVLDKQNRKG